MLFADLLASKKERTIVDIQPTQGPAFLGIVKEIKPANHLLNLTGELYQVTVVRASSGGTYEDTVTVRATSTQELAFSEHDDGEIEWFCAGPVS